MKTKFALVTGASEGIGFEFCKVLASKGYNILLVARTVEKLQKAAGELEQAFNVETQIIACDLAEPRAGQALFDQVVALTFR